MSYVWFDNAAGGPPITGFAGYADGFGGVNPSGPLPVGWQIGDIFIASILGGIVLPPSGWTIVGSAVTLEVTAGKLVVYWHRAAGGDAAQTWTGTITTASIAGFRGCVATGSPIDAFTAETGTTYHLTTVGSNVFIYLPRAGYDADIGFGDADAGFVNPSGAGLTWANTVFNSTPPGDESWALGFATSSKASPEAVTGSSGQTFVGENPSAGGDIILSLTPA